MNRYIWPVDLPWSELDDLVAENKAYYERSGIWAQIRNDYIINTSIDSLVKSGWKVIFDYDDSCNMHKKEIIINIEHSREDHYTRDKRLFHEIVHAYYENMLYDGLVTIKHGYEHNAIVEWLARKLRANPRLLKQAILSFNLTPRVYDKASHIAFPWVNLQLAFEFVIEQSYLDFEDLSIVLMN